MKKDVDSRLPSSWVVTKKRFGERTVVDIELERK